MGDMIKGYDTILGIQFDLRDTILGDTEIVSPGSVTLNRYDPLYPPDFLMSGPVVSILEIEKVLDTSILKKFMAANNGMGLTNLLLLALINLPKP